MLAKCFVSCHTFNRPPRRGTHNQRKGEKREGIKDHYAQTQPSFLFVFPSSCTAASHHWPKIPFWWNIRVHTSLQESENNTLQPSSGSGRTLLLKSTFWQLFPTSNGNGMSFCCIPVTPSDPCVLGIITLYFHVDFLSAHRIQSPLKAETISSSPRNPK